MKNTRPFCRTLLATLVTIFISWNIQTVKADKVVLDFTLGCRARWMSYPDTYVPGGSASAFITTQQACLDECAGKNSCVAALINNNTNPIQCRLIKDKSSLKNTTSRAGYNLYELDSTCQKSVPANQVQCSDIWTRTSGQRRPGGTPVPSAADTERCLAICLGNTVCVMFAVRTVGTFECILYMSASDKTSVPIKDSSYQEYDLITRCGSSTGPTTLVLQQEVCGTWTSQPNVNSLNAAFAPGQNSVALCQAFCIAQTNPACVAIDFDNTGTDTQGCWYHTDPQDLVETFDTDLVTQYRLVRSQCGSSSTGPSTSSGPTLKDPGDCAVWSTLVNTNSLNAKQASSFQTLQACQDFCVSTPTCVAIDFDQTGFVDTQGCWYHDDINDLNDVFDTANVNQYRLSRSCATTASTSGTTRGGICPTWTMVPNTNSLNAVQAKQFQTVAACQNYCLTLARCFAIDFDHTGFADTQGCWYHPDPIDLNQVFDTANVDQYRYTTECTSTGVTSSSSSASVSTGQCPATWTVIANTNSINADLFSQFNTVDTCRRYCESIPACVAVDFDHTGTPAAGCWVHTSASDLTDLYEAVNVDQHRISRDCAGGSSTSTSIATVTGGCASWTAFPQSNSINAVRFTDYPTLAQCQAYCVTVAQCAAIDFDTSSDTTSNGCWIHTNRDDLTTLYEALTVTQYRLDRTCQSSTSAGPTVTGTSVSGGAICNDWAGFRGRQSINGIPYNALTTLAACEAQCINLPACVAIDFDTTAGANSNCWVHLDPADLEQVYTAPDSVTQYRLTRECVTSVPVSCESFILSPNQLSINGLPYLDVKDATGCQTLCAANPKCVAVDYDYSTLPSNGCWVHENADDLLPDNVFPATNVDQYVIDRNACFTGSTTTGTTVTTTKMTGTTAVGTVTTGESGTSGTSMSSGTGTTVSGATGTSGTGSVTTSGGTTGTTAVETTTAISTAAGCRYSWNPIPNTNIPSGIPTRDTTVEACQRRCINLYPCFAVDIDRNVNAIFCWLHLVDNPQQPFNNVTHMVLTRDPLCPETITTTGTTSTTTPTTTTGAQICYVKTLLNANANGGTNLGRMSVDRCVQSCRDQYPFCVAVDYRASDNSCYLQTSLSGRQWNTCCTRYEFFCTSTACNDTFVSYTNRAPVVMGSTLTSATTVEMCQDACYTNANCSGFAWGTASRFPANQRCLLVIGATGDVTFSADYSFYAREVCQANQVFSTASTVVPPTPAPGACVLDIVFVVDISGSVAENQPPGVNNLALIRQFLKNIIQPESRINLGTFLDRVGLVVFESSSRTLYTFADPQSIDSFTYTAINGIPVPAGETNTPAGLDRASDILAANGRNAQKVVMLITDGQTTQEFRINLAPSLQRLKDLGTTRIAIGITDAISMDDLTSFASDPSYVTTMQSFDSLINVQAFVTNIMLVQCNRPTIFDTNASPQSTVPVSTTPGSTSTTTTSPPLPPEARRVAFSVASSSSQGNQGRVSLSTVVANYNNHFDPSNSQWNVQATAIYMVELCAGLAAGQTAEVRIQGSSGTNIIGISWESRIHNGEETSCRSGLIFPDRGSQISMLLESGNLLGDSANRMTMFTGFSVSDVISDLALTKTLYAVMTTPPTSNGPISFRPVIGPTDASVFDGPSGTYTCQVSGPHVVSVSLGVAATTQTQAVISNDVLPLELTRNSRLYNGVTTFSRTVILDCSPGRRFQINQITGTLTSSTNGFNYDLTSLLVFPYLPRSLQTPVAWQAYKAYIVDTDLGPADPFLFNNVTVNQGNAYSSDSSSMIAPVAGFYFMSLSVGSSIQKPFTLSLKKVTQTGNEEVVFSILHRVTVLNEEDMYSHSVVLQLAAGEEVKAVGEQGGSLFSGVVGYQAGFGGCLLYSV